MKYKKKLLLLTTFALVLLTAACTKGKNGNGALTTTETSSIEATVTPEVDAVSPTPEVTTEELFDEYTEQLFLEEIKLNTIN